jgi:hypothetical protein
MSLKVGICMVNWSGPVWVSRLGPGFKIRYQTQNQLGLGLANLGPVPFLAASHQ